MADLINCICEALNKKTPAAVRNQLMVLGSNIPLTSRIADFASRAIQLRTLGSPRRFLEAFHERIPVLTPAFTNRYSRHFLGGVYLPRRSLPRQALRG